MNKQILLLLSLAFGLSSCSDDKETSNQESVAKGPLAQLVLVAKPEKAQDITSIRTTAKPGDDVTFTGEVIGSDSVFMDGRAIMIMGDPKKLTACNKIEGDKCERPWDVCCDDPDVITASIVTVQVVDDAGKPLKETLKGTGGVKELSTVTITGVIAEGSNESNMLVNATGIYVHPEG